MSDEASVQAPRTLLVLIIVKVVVILAVWLGIFLAMFLGYFTVPLLVVGGLALLYSMADFGLIIAIKNQEKAEELRHAFLKSGNRKIGNGKKGQDSQL